MPDHQEHADQTKRQHYTTGTGPSQVSDVGRAVNPWPRFSPVRGQHENTIPTFDVANVRC